MKIESLYIKNIGPFKEETMEFATLDNIKSGEQPVTIITGMNGAGKSIVIDAIRAILSAQVLERNIVADEKNFCIKIETEYDGKGMKSLIANQLEYGHLKYSDYSNLNKYFSHGYELPGNVYGWVVDYWSSRLPSDSFQISNMVSIDHKNVLKDAMLGKKSNVALTNFICQVDYLRSSEMPEEKALGESLYALVRTVINECLDNGEFLYVRRVDSTPIVQQNGHQLSLEKLSSGNIFLIEHLLMLLCKMYSVCVLNQIPPSEINKIPGLLLVDEIENHLHPKWQKKILGIIRRTFPNLQIILTTHSPFVVSSMDGARIYTCISRGDHSTIENETDKYSHLPVEEILASGVFAVSSFNDEITSMMNTRKEAIRMGRMEEAQEIEQKLLEINPEYFMYLNPQGDYKNETYR
ncbi:MAG: AAA family ATPase [Bacteroides sp.]|nr:AAA family ATPase [Bacteroides sp.]